MVDAVVAKSMVAKSVAKAATRVRVNVSKRSATQSSPRECESGFAQRFALQTGQLHTAMALQGGANPAPRYPMGGGSKSTTNRALDRAIDPVVGKAT